MLVKDFPICNFALNIEQRNLQKWERKTEKEIDLRNIALYYF